MPGSFMPKEPLMSYLMTRFKSTKNDKNRIVKNKKGHVTSLID